MSIYNKHMNEWARHKLLIYSLRFLNVSAPQKSEVFPAQAIKAYGGEDVYNHALLNMALNSTAKPTH